MKGKKLKSIFSLAFVMIFVLSALAFIFVKSSSINSNAMSLTSSKSMCVMETSSKRVLYNKGDDTILPMASTTKIMTAITAIENCADLDAKFEVSSKSIGISGTSLYLREGEVFSVRDLLYGLMLVSGNDASVAIANRVGGNEKQFVNLMNETARKIGAFNSHFDNPHGLDSKTHYTTAYDLALITSYALNNPVFSEVVSTKNTKIVNQDGKTRYLRNKNKLLHTMQGCIGVKTGFTDDAGRCLVSACERDGMKVVCVVLNCGPMFEESESLLNKAFDEYKLVDLTQNYCYEKTIPVVDGKKDYVNVGTKKHFFYPLKEQEIKTVKYDYCLVKNVEAPVNIDEEVGEIKIYIDKNLHFSEKIYTMESVRRKSIWAKIKTMIDKW